MGPLSRIGVRTRLTSFFTQININAIWDTLDLLGIPHSRAHTIITNTVRVGLYPWRLTTVEGITKPGVWFFPVQAEVWLLLQQHFGLKLKKAFNELVQKVMKDWFSRWALYSPDEIAIKEWETGRTLSYGTLNQMANHLAWYFTEELGLKTGDRVAVLADNCIEYIVLFAMAQKTGLILVPLNYRLSAPELAYLIKDAEPRVLAVEEKYQDLAAVAQQKQALEFLWKMEALWEWLLQTNAKPVRHFNPITLQANHPIFILYTSGTTGFPKGALLPIDVVLEQQHC